ncbi:MAG TPA: hypothetical protein VLA56_04990 [Pseudomonadales bacterium]|nr:hypothetical protein [Pseudomonadales bacterium]
MSGLPTPPSDPQAPPADAAGDAPIQPPRCLQDTSADGSPGRPDWRIWLGLGLTAGWLVLGTVYIGTQMGWGHISEQPADVLGSFLEGAFAPLAFLWLVIGYFLQQKELAQNTDALRLQFREIQRSAEQAVIQSETIAASERHARQETFLQIAEQVRKQLGAIIGLLYISSQGATGTGSVDGEELAKLWSELNKGDPDIFSRKMLELYGTEDEEGCYALFYGTEIRARHSNNFIFTFERLLARARAADTDGILEDAITGSANGFVYRIAIDNRRRAPAELADVATTGRDVRVGTLTRPPTAREGTPQITPAGPQEAPQAPRTATGEP